MLKEGAKAPAFSAEADTGGTISSKDLKGKRFILFFYPKDLTPGCTQEACDFRDSYAKLKKQGLLVFGVSKDSVESHLKFRDKHDLPFPLLSDADGKLCKAFGVWQEKSLYGRKFMGIVRSTFIIGPDQRIERIYSKVKVTGHVEEVISACRLLEGPRAQERAR
jgi:thioredoxin-dependent peroxiredoxin